MQVILRNNINKRILAFLLAMFMLFDGNLMVLAENGETVRDDIEEEMVTALGSKEFILDIVNRLNGSKYLIRGNHDKWGASTYEDFGFNVDELIKKIDAKIAEIEAEEKKSVKETIEEAKPIEKLEETIQKIKRNANVDLALDSLMVELCKI